MSSGLELLFIEAKPGQWYWIRQSGFCPVDCWDWREHEPDVVGPFASYEAADDSYSKNERNTGGSSMQAYRPECDGDAMLQKLIAGAKTPAKYYSPW